MITIFPALSISVRAICTPAAVTALTALVRSACRNVEGARAMRLQGNVVIGGHAVKSSRLSPGGPSAGRLPISELSEVGRTGEPRGVVVPICLPSTPGKIGKIGKIAVFLFYF